MRLVGMAPGTVSEAGLLYREGWSLAALGREYGVAASTVRRHLIGAGVVMRLATDRPS